tara:strand:+ start:1917 stop:2159 length:243 start_codon:yes stop_codon:yes gene_type:complete
MRVRFKLGKLYIIEWLDAAGYLMEDLEKAKPCLCLTVGWVKVIEADHIVLASSLYSDNTEFGDFTVLPVGMIKKSTEVKT